MARRICALLLALLLGLMAPCMPWSARAEGAGELPDIEAPTPEPTPEPTPDPTPEVTPEPTPEVTPEVTSEPTQEPTSEVTPEPMPEVTPEPTPEVTPEPTPEVTPEPTPESTPEETSGPTAGPSLEPTPEVTAEPTPGTTPEPTAEPDLSPEPSVEPAGLIITPEGATLLESGIWQFPAPGSGGAPDATPAPGGDVIRFRWTDVEGAQEYLWSVSDAGGGSVASGSQPGTALELPAQTYLQGQFALSVQACLGEECLEASVTFEIAQAEQPDRPNRPNRPGGFGGFGGANGGGPSGASEEEQGFRVTPGTALTSSHSSGTKDMSAYAAAVLSLGDEAVRELRVSDAAPALRLSDGGAFTAALEGGALILSCEGADEQWLVNPLTLKFLRAGGVERLELQGSDGSTSIATDFEFMGEVYARYRGQGYVSKDFVLRISAGGIAVYIDGETYALSDERELIRG